jgi:hypothetical protein
MVWTGGLHIGGYEKSASNVRGDQGRFALESMDHDISPPTILGKRQRANKLRVGRKRRRIIRSLFDRLVDPGSAGDRPAPKKIHAPTRLLGYGIVVFLWDKLAQPPADRQRLMQRSL